MIEIPNVRVTPHELRPALKAWPSLRWLSAIPMLWLYVGMLATVLLSLRGPSHPLIPFVQLVMLVGVFALSVLTTRLTARVARGNPTDGLASDWRIDETGVKFTSLLREHSFDWRGIMRVVEDTDRFIFVASLMTNPVLPTRLMTEDQKVELRALIAEVTASGRMGAGA